MVRNSRSALESDTYGHNVISQTSGPLQSYVLQVSPLPLLYSVCREKKSVHSLQRKPVLWPQLLQLCQHTVRYGWNTFGHQAVHHSLHKLNLVLNREIDKVGIHQNTVRGTKVGVMGKEKT